MARIIWNQFTTGTGSRFPSLPATVAIIHKDSKFCQSGLLNFDSTIRLCSDLHNSFVKSTATIIQQGSRGANAGYSKKKLAIQKRG